MKYCEYWSSAATSSAQSVSPNAPVAPGSSDVASITPGSAAQRSNQPTSAGVAGRKVRTATCSRASEPEQGSRIQHAPARIVDFRVVAAARVHARRILVGQVDRAEGQFRRALRAQGQCV